MFSASRKKMPRFEGGTGSRAWNKVSGQQARTARAADPNRPIPALFVVLPDGSLKFGCCSWLTSRKSTLSDAVVPTAKKATPVGITGQVSLIVCAYTCDDGSTNNLGQAGGRPNSGTTRSRVGHRVCEFVAGSDSPCARA